MQCLKTLEFSWYWPIRWVPKGNWARPNWSSRAIRAGPFCIPYWGPCPFFATQRQCVQNTSKAQWEQGCPILHCRNTWWTDTGYLHEEERSKYRSKGIHIVLWPFFSSIVFSVCLSQLLERSMRRRKRLVVSVDLALDLSGRNGSESSVYVFSKVRLICAHFFLSLLGLLPSIGVIWSHIPEGENCHSMLERIWNHGFNWVRILKFTFVDHWLIPFLCCPVSRVLLFLSVKIRA